MTALPRLPLCKPITPAMSAPSGGRQAMQAALTAAIAKTRAEHAARVQALSPNQVIAIERRWEARTERSMRAKEAQEQKQRKTAARRGNPQPVDTAMWAKPMSMMAASDTRLTMGARVALQVIRSLTARKKRISRSGLAVVLGVHPRTAQRYLSELRERGYIRTRLIANRAGWVIAQVIEITEKVLPKHHRPRTAASLADGVARAFSIPESRRNQGETELSPCKSKNKYLTGNKVDGGGS